MSKWNAGLIPSQEGKVAIVTGANSGLGYFTSKGLAENGAEVVMACRNKAKAEEAVDTLLKDVPGAKLKVMELDLSDLSSVKTFTEQFTKEYKKLDLLINNAGLMAIPYRKTKDGFEMQFGVNHLGHFALSAQLFALLRSTPGARIVIVSSMAHKFGNMDLDNLNWEKNYRKWSAYGRSKLANILFMLELAERVDSKGIELKVLAAHPGYAASNLLEKGAEMNGRPWLIKAGHMVNSIVAQSTEMGALPSLYAATSEEVEQGGYYGPGGFNEMRGHPVRVYPNNKKIGKDSRVKLWERSEELTGVSFLSNANLA